MDLWAFDGKVIAYRPENASDLSDYTWTRDEMLSSPAAWREHAVKLLDAHLAAQKPAKVVVGWRVKDVDPETNYTYASSNGWVDNSRTRFTFATRKDAVKRLRWARREFTKADIRLVRVTRRVG